MLVISDSSERGQSCIYTLPIGGGRPQRVTADVPSYWHGWSPDGQTLAYVGKRDGDFNLFTIDRDGGKEKQLTFGAGHCDGPDYTPNGAWIWFNADHHGKLSDLWRIRPDGSELTQMTDDKWVNWFPHPSPDGNHILYLAYGPHVTGHPRGEQVSLKLMSPDGGSERIIAEFYGGQGSINVPNWSPDSTEFAYMRYAP
jgi:Tol biopolymer transport system component